MFKHNHVLSIQGTAKWQTAHLGEQREDGNAGVAAHNRHVNLANIDACLLSVESLGTNL